MKKRKTDLFRFVTLRSPELIDADKKALGFIHPDFLYGDSEFLEFIDDLDIPGSRTSMVNYLPNFDAFPNVQHIKDTYTNLWEFSLWLSKNRNELVRSELDSIVSSPISDAIWISIWDNLCYDLLSDTNPYVRQACLQMIVARNFALKYATYSPGTTTDPLEIAEEARLLKRLANAKVLIHRVFSLDKMNTTQALITYDFASRRNLLPQHNANIASCLSKDLIAIKGEIEALKKQFQTDYNAALESAQDSYEATAKSRVDTYLASNPDATEETIPDDTVEKFEFIYNLPLSSDYAEGKISDRALNFLSENSLEEATFDGALNVINDQLQVHGIKASNQKRNKISTIIVNGAKIKPSKSALHDYVVSFEKDKFNEALGDYRVFLTLDAGYQGAFVSSSTVRFSIGASTVLLPSNCPKLLCGDGSLIFIELFSGDSVSLSPCDSLIIDIQLTLSNGKKIHIYKTGITDVLQYSGAAVTIVDLNAATPLYGVNRMGIADFRRVEQELCCYIPGEVSHIENIMAREYKEKFSRNLNRSEVSTELTSEREAENLSDTTSTERFELSSEISEVIQKDRSQNYGFNASTSGKVMNKFSFDASAYGDFGFSQSSSDSNSEAQSYAEDVTRRALERIVQKTSLKRTSTMIREYEETNKHGFDNREGTENVTGVYRWVDKVYKNYIVNYGKRLMYEFMIPEPAKWYKDAIIVKAEEEQSSAEPLSGGQTSAVIKPTSLEENGIQGASDITRENFQRLAALYGANPEAPMDATTSVSASFGESPGSGDTEKSFQYDTLLVPVNYRCTSLSGSTAGYFKGNVPMFAYMKVSIAGKHFTKNLPQGFGNFNIPMSANGLNVTSNAQVSAVTKKITTFNIGITLNCELLPTIYQQWQQDTYDEIRRAYESKMTAFKDAEAQQAMEQAALAQELEDSESTIERNPRFNKDIIQTELKRLCIEMLTKPFGYEQGKNFYHKNQCEVPELELTSALDTYSSSVKFFEQAFDWELLAQKFYPYYWAEKCDWKSLYQEQDSIDPIFQQFLQSGMGRVMVPVKKGFEDAVVFYMQTGKIWSGAGMVTDTDDELYVSIAEEMVTLKGKVEGQEWETIVPTDLTLIQARSVLLDEGGLPCCEEDPQELAALNLEPDTLKLSPVSGANV